MSRKGKSTNILDALWKSLEVMLNRRVERIRVKVGQKANGMLSEFVRPEALSVHELSQMTDMLTSAWIEFFHGVVSQYFMIFSRFRVAIDAVTIIGQSGPLETYSWSNTDRWSIIHRE
jgi:hypothetical protein